jgi:opacity protein-like surface antigen
MSSLASRFSLAIVLMALCLGARTACAQVAPVRYWIPGGPFGFGGGSTEGESPDAYGNFPNFEAGGSSFSQSRYQFPNGMFVSGERGAVGWNGIGQAGAFGNASGLSYEGVQFGYAFKGVGGLPVTVFAGFDKLKYDPTTVGPLAPFGMNSGPGYSLNAGVEFKPTSNLSLSLGVGYTQQQSGRIDSDINSPLLPGQSPIFIDGRR